MQTKQVFYKYKFKTRGITGFQSRDKISNKMNFYIMLRLEWKLQDRAINLFL